MQLGTTLACKESNKPFIMKKTSLLFLASLAVLTTGASAAPTQLQSEPIVLPTYVVTAPRYLPAEEQINANLKEFSHKADMPVLVPIELTSLKIEAVQHNPLAEGKQPLVAVRIAKS